MLEIRQQKQLWKAIYPFTAIVLIFVLLLSSTGTASAQQQPPPFPSSFYGEIHVTDFTTPVVVDNQVVAFMNESPIPVASGSVRTFEDKLVYTIDVPGLLTDEGHLITFKIQQGTTIINRVVATGIWHTGKNVIQDIHPPAAQLSSAEEVIEGSPLTVDASATTDWLASDTLTYGFDCNNDGTYDAPQTEATGTCTFSDNGSYTFGVRVIDQQGGESTASRTVTVTNAAPQAVFAASANVTETQSFTLSFTNSTDPSSVDTAAGFTYSFDCGTGVYSPFGSASTATCPTTDNGSLVTRGQIQDKDSGIKEYTATVAVANVQPALVISGAASVDEGALYSLSLTASGDPGPDTITGWTITWCEGVSETVTANPAAVTHTYNNGPASCTISATATDEDGTYTAGNTVTVSVNNVVPVVNAGAASTTISQGGTLTGSGSFTDPGADGWTATVNYGDGSEAQGLALTGKTFVLSHAYTRVGTHHVTVTVNDATASGTAAFDVTITNVAPTATFNAPTSVDEGSDITLSLNSPQDPGAQDETYTYAFDCGTGGYGAFGSASTATCPTTDNGERTVKGIIRDSNGGETEYSASVTINNVLPTNVSAGGPYTVASGTALTLQGAYTCPTADTCASAWDLDNNAVFETPGNPVTYTWYQTGSYTVRFRVTDSDGSEVTSITTITVSAVSQGITLQPGWNLVSFNLHPASTLPADVLASIAEEYDLVYIWEDGAWRHFDPKQGFSDSVTLDETKGFWINITASESVTLTVSGSVPTTTPIGLKAGWNLVGYPSASGKALPAVMNASSFSMIYAFHANETADPWKVYDVASPDWTHDLTQLTPGWGYWIYSSTPSTWSVTYP